MIKTKTCTKCGIEKDISEFYKQKSGKHGYRAECKECIKQYTKDNREKIALRNKNYYINNKEVILLQNKKWRSNNIEKLVVYNKKYRAENREKLIKQKKEYNKTHKEFYTKYHKEYGKGYYIKNIDKIKLQHKEWKQNNKDKVNLDYAKRRALKLKATPVLTKQELQDIELIYKLAQQLSNIGGTNYHVDHIVPLSKGGLHHPDNLQVLTQRDNLCKSAKLDYKYQDEVFKL